MAFRELSQEELELLTDSQREVYEKKLEIHRERAKFVEQLEKMDQVKIKPFQPTLKPIPSVSKAPEKQFVKTEHQIEKIQNVKVKAAEVHVQPIPAVEAVVLPQVARPAKVRAVSIEKQPAEAPVLPGLPLLRTPSKQFAAAEPVKAQLGAPVLVQAPNVIARSPESVKVKVDAQKLAPAVVAKVRVPALSEGPDVRPDLPRIAVAVPTDRTIRTDSPKMTALPAVAATRPADISYVRPETAPVALDKVCVAVSPEKTIGKVEKIQPQIPTAVRVRVRTHAYQAPEIQKTAAAGVQPVRVPSRTFEPTAPAAVKAVQPVRVDIPKINYQKREYEIQRHSADAAISIPDPNSNEILRALLNAKK